MRDPQTPTKQAKPETLNPNPTSKSKAVWMLGGSLPRPLHEGWILVKGFNLSYHNRDLFYTK